MKKEKGITLIALAITIIVLLVLAGISIVLLMSDNGILRQSKNTSDQHKIEEYRQELTLILLEGQLENHDSNDYESALKNSIKTKIIATGNYNLKDKEETEETEDYIIAETKKEGYKYKITYTDVLYLEQNSNHVGESESQHEHDYEYYDGETQIGKDHPTEEGEYIEKCTICGEIKETHTITENVPIDGMVGHYTYLCTCGENEIEEHDISGGATNTTPTICKKCNMKLVEIQNVTITGYDVYLYGIDKNEVDKVQFPTWTNNNGQDDIQSNWDTNSAASGKYQENGTWHYRVNISDHYNEVGIYYTHVYGYKSNTRKYLYGMTINVPTAYKTLSIELWQRPATENTSTTIITIGGTNYSSVGGTTSSALNNWWYKKTYTVNVQVGTEATIKSKYGASTGWYDKNKTFIRNSETIKFRMPPNDTKLFVVGDVNGANWAKRGLNAYTNIIFY